MAALGVIKNDPDNNIPKHQLILFRVIVAT
jgi:hypothetical protein